MVKLFVEVKNIRAGDFVVGIGKVVEVVEAGTFVREETRRPSKFETVSFVTLVLEDGKRVDLPKHHSRHIDRPCLVFSSMTLQQSRKLAALLGLNQVAFDKGMTFDGDFVYSVGNEFYLDRQGKEVAYYNRKRAEFIVWGVPGPKVAYRDSLIKLEPVS
jgi:hypothetical protein